MIKSNSVLPKTRWSIIRAHFFLSFNYVNLLFFFLGIIFVDCTYISEETNAKLNTISEKKIRINEYSISAIQNRIKFRTGTITINTCMYI